MPRTILVVEDDPDLARGLAFNLEREGHQVELAGRGADGLQLIRAGGLDLILLDLTLPDLDGLEVLKTIRSEGIETPVICLTARDQETDVVMGLGLGADDYVTKPFSLAELLARVLARLRRAPEGGGQHLQLGPVTVDLRARCARHPDRDEELTPIETEILQYLAARPGQAVDRQQLLRDLWGLERRHSTRTLDNHVARLRRKIEVDPANPVTLLTVHGVGYRLVLPDEGGRS
jgi:DNA-binding response OmpR family regulator